MNLCLLALLGLPLLAFATPYEEPKRTDEQYIKVEVQGVLRHGIVAIGGETTGTTITAQDITWELDLGSRKELRSRAGELDQKLVRVTGKLKRKKGVEIAQRSIVQVESLEAAKSK